MNYHEVIFTIGIICTGYLIYQNKQLEDKLKTIKVTSSYPANDQDILEQSDFVEVDARLFNSGSSAWCKGSNNIDRTCKFHHLCYSPLKDDFIFFHGPRSWTSGIPHDRFSPALADLSSVPDHNTQYFNYVDLPLNAIRSFDTIYLIKGQSFIFNRFNPANLMHVLHDDLLPIFHTVSEDHHGDIPGIRLVLFDSHQPLDYFHLYKLFSSETPLLKGDLNKTGNSLICFEKATIGLSNSTIWYQYGFQNPQGPIDSFKLTVRTIDIFTDYLKNKLGVNKDKLLQSRPKGILIGRRTNRLILNEGELLMALATELHISVQLMYLEDSSMKEVIQKISSVNLLIGVHGSALALSMFLPRGSLLVEIFPYAINPDHYTPYKTLVSIPGLDINYLSWQNMDPSNTVYHRNAPKEFGGIDHLTTKEQIKILESTEVPLHLCCNDPEWLFRIYQDTRVDIPSFFRKVRTAIAEIKPEGEKYLDLDSHMHPAKVEGVACKKLENVDKVSLEVEWQQPWNLQYLMVNDAVIHYEVWIQKASVDNTRAWILNTTRYTFEADFVSGGTYFIWIRCIINNRIGPFSSVSIC